MRRGLRDPELKKIYKKDYNHVKKVNKEQIIIYIHRYI